jgi:photosystem II stability/assembly factor-like uncharacterized protein
MDRIPRIIQRLLPLAAASAALALTTGSAAAQPATTTTTTPAPVSTGHSGWTWGSPTPQGQDLTAVSFQGADGYAVGALGTVLRSEDGGQTWTGLPSGTTDQLDHVQELSPTTVIAGGGCTVLESTDSGESFTTLPLGLPVDCQRHRAGSGSSLVAGLSFSTATEGYVELQDGTLFYTDDGGQTVQARSPVPVGASGVATGLAFSSPTTGLAISDRGLVELTTDGGNSWNQVLQVSGQLYGITIVSPTLIYAVGSEGDLISSTDGGETWTTLPLTISGAGLRPDLSSITCSDAEDCLITTDEDNEMVRTTDGGMTGTVVSVSDSALTGVAFTTGSGVVGVGALGATVLSSDAAQTFPTVSSPGLTEFDRAGPLAPGRAPGSAYLPGDAGTIAATTDSGAQWSELRVPTNVAIDSVAFASANDGYALDSAGTLRRTTDAGASWSSFAPTYSSHAILVTPSSRALLLVGPRGIRRSTDGGQIVQGVGGRVRVSRGRGPLVNSLRLDAASAAGAGVVASGPSGIVVSTDGGVVWNRVATPVDPRKVISVSLVSSGRLWVLSSAGRLYETTDGGRHWQADDAIGAIGAPDAVSFGSRQDGLVAFGGGHVGVSGDFGDAAVLSTHDGGRTWEPQIVAGSLGLAVSATPTVDYAVGDYGIPGNDLGFFSTTDGGASPLRSTLRISTAHRSLTQGALKRAGDRLVIRGHLTPVLSANEVVAVSYRTGRGGWSRPLNVRVATGGGFVVHLRKIRASTEIVAQALGDGDHGGAGTPVLQVTVRR